MTNKLYPKAKEKFLSAGISWIADTIKLILVDKDDYTYSDTHEFLTDVPSASRVATSTAFTGKGVTNGVATASNFSFATATGDSGEALILYKDTGVESTSPLIAYVDNNVSFITVNADAAANATTLSINAAPVAMSTGEILYLVTGSGVSAVTLTGNVAVGATSISIQAITSSITSGAVYRYKGLVVVPNGNDIPVLFDAAGIFSI